MKIKAEELSKFLDIVQMQGEVVIKEIKLDFNPDGLEIVAMDPTNICLVRGVLHKKAFTDYVEVGNLIIDEIGNYINVTKRFKGEVELKIEGNLITLDQGKKSVSSELMYQGTYKETPYPDLKYSSYLNISVEKIKEIFDDVKTNEGTEIILEASEGKILFKNTGKHKFTTELDAPEIKENIKVKFGQALIASLQKIKKGDLKIGLKTDYPILVMYEDENMKIDIIVAPRVEQN